MTENEKVFISYSWDSEEHKTNILSFANKLVNQGVDVILDQYIECPPEGWPLWMENSLEEAKFVLIFFTEKYFNRMKKQQQNQGGAGVTWEGTIIYQDLYNLRGHNNKFIPIVFSQDNINFITKPLKSTTIYNLENNKDYNKLYCRLTGQTYVKKPALGKRKQYTEINTAIINSQECNSQQKSSSIMTAKHLKEHVTEETDGLEKFLNFVEANTKEEAQFYHDKLEEILTILKNVPSNVLKNLGRILERVYQVKDCKNLVSINDNFISILASDIKNLMYLDDREFLQLAKEFNGYDLGYGDMDYLGGYENEVLVVRNYDYFLISLAGFCDKNNESLQDMLKMLDFSALD